DCIACSAGSWSALESSKVSDTVVGLTAAWPTPPKGPTSSPATSRAAAMSAVANQIPRLRHPPDGTDMTEPCMAGHPREGTITVTGSDATPSNGVYQASHSATKIPAWPPGNGNAEAGQSVLHPWMFLNNGCHFGKSLPLS